MEGNQTSVIDNATCNSTQIALIGAVLMSNESQSINILKNDFNGTYGPPRYMVVFGTFQDSSSNGYPEAGYGDEGKWTWFVEISGNDTLLCNGTPANGNAALFGNYTIGENLVGQNATSSGTPVANQVGQNTTFYKLLTYAKYRVLENATIATAAADAGLGATYFTEAALFPSTLVDYDGVCPIVAVYNVNY
jgi:hypothetical protein